MMNLRICVNGRGMKPSINQSCTQYTGKPLGLHPPEPQGRPVALHRDVSLWHLKRAMLLNRNLSRPADERTAEGFEQANRLTDYRCAGASTDFNRLSVYQHG
jgi:hypothetical protein